MSTALAQKNVLVNVDQINGEIQKQLPEAIVNFLDMSQTATDRATYYNSKGEQNEAVAKIHRGLFQLDRGVYGLCLLMPGVTDYARQMGIGLLLDNPRSDGLFLLNDEQEGKLLAFLSRFMEPQRLFKLYGQLRQNRVNNSRTKKLILRSILMSPKLDYWSIKYRTKLHRALEHAWDKRMTGILRSILAKKFNPVPTEWTDKEKAIVTQHIDKFVLESRFQPNQVQECVAFILGLEQKVTLPLFKAYVDARKDLSKGVGLPKENLFYLRSRFHKGFDKGKVYEISKPAMTDRQKMQTQKAAKKAGASAEVTEFDPLAVDSVRLYIYAYEVGLSDKIQKALTEKAKIAASALMTSHDKVGILIDASESHRGDSTQALRPIAIALATRDMLVASAKQAFVEYAGGTVRDGLIQPRGETALGKSLVRLLKQQPDAVYVFSDGYENAPAGEFAETMKKVRDLGITTPVFHIAPVLAAETSGIRELSEETKALPISKPEAIGSSMLRAVLKTDLKQGLLGIARTVLPQLGYKVKED